jgi:dTDP-4-amino-4,6-dideoxygalactose transaminase
MNVPPMRYIRPMMPDPEEWLPFLKESYQSGYYANFGPAVRRFERSLQEKYARGRAVVTAPNATNGLVAALQALGVKGKVLTPSYTFPATAQAILMAGCTPLFCDVSEDSWELAPAAVAEALQDPDVGAIMHVRAYGFSHDLAWLERLAKARAVPLIVDSAAAIGGTASLDGVVGQQGDMEVFSFHATKVFGIGEGAAIFSAVRHEQSLRDVSNFGIRYPDVVSRGQNSKMSDFQAAVGLAVLGRIDAYIACRRQVAEYYHRSVAGVPGIRSTPDPKLSPWQSYPVRLSEEKDVGLIMQRALELGLELKRGYYRPLHETSCFGTYVTAPLPVSSALAAQVLCLPVYSDMDDGESARVMQLFLQALRG